MICHMNHIGDLFGHYSIKHVKIYLGIFGLRGYSTYGAIWSAFFARNIFNVSHQTSQIAIEYKLFSAAKLSALWVFFTMHRYEKYRAL